MNPDPEQEKKPADEASPPDTRPDVNACPEDGDSRPPATPTGLEEEGSIEIEFVNDSPEDGIELVDESAAAEGGGQETEPAAADEAPPSADQQRIASLTRLVARSRIEMDLTLSEIGDLKKERAGLQRDARDSGDQLKRAQADFAAVRAQLERKLEEQISKGPEAMIKELMTVVDHLDMALRTAPHEDPLYQGIEMTRSELLAILRRNGAEPVEAVGAPFNPRWHEAAAAEYQEGLTVDTVIDELRRGWQRGGKVLRASMVRVGKPPEKS